MKKVFAIVAIAAMFVACNKPAQQEGTDADTLNVETVVEEDTLKNDTATVVDAEVEAVTEAAAEEVAK